MIKFFMLMVGVVMGAAVVSNSTLMQEPVAQDLSAVVIGHRVAPNGTELVSYADGHVRSIAL